VFRDIIRHCHNVTIIRPDCYRQPPPGPVPPRPAPNPASQRQRDLPSLSNDRSAAQTRMKEAQYVWLSPGNARRIPWTHELTIWFRHNFRPAGPHNPIFGQLYVHVA
jgi:hypothetical protein